MTAVRQLRILSGTHAGASLELAEGKHSLGCHDDCDIAVTDWRFGAVALSVAADGVVMAQWGDASPHAMRFEDFTPIDFAGVVVCVGPCDTSWPERPELLANLQTAASAIAPPGITQFLRKLDRRLVSCAAGAVIGVALVGWIASAASKPPELTKATLQSAHASLQRALEAAAPGRLHVSEVRGTLVVEGLVDDARQAHAAAAAMDAVPRPLSVMPKISVASDIAETIRSAVGLPGARINYRGAGVFAFAVRTDDIAATQAAVNRVAADLAPTVRRIDAVLDEAPAASPPLPAVVSALVTDDGVSVMQTHDGVKHLIVTSPGADSLPSGDSPSDQPRAEPVTGSPQ